MYVSLGTSAPGPAMFRGRLKEHGIATGVVDCSSVLPSNKTIYKRWVYSSLAVVLSSH